ncbi:hypothetical protein F0562_004130 [Nyssa sinensis]|uniref:Uncharacterized protein n=1 Tax=Nyssa sinensis TaxID=561372 RepID=A0A5J5C2H1_9ASTE|nr:hypothetical protein F0562_004130 [Nyssa sinensis]
MGLWDSFLNWFRRLFQEAEVSLVGLQNAGKSALVNAIARFHTTWELYCRGASAILYVVDAADRDSVPISKSELHDFLMKSSLNGIPLLVLGNKTDKSEALSKQALMDQLSLETITDREVCCYMISCKDSINIDAVIDWLINHSKTVKRIPLV